MSIALSTRTVTDLLEVALLVTSALEANGITYSVGGSLASGFSGEPRATLDVDISVALETPHVEPLLAALGDAFYADGDALLRAIGERSSANLLHHESGIKIDLFVAASELDARQLERRRRIRVADNPDRFLYVHSPEDILLQKLHWYRLGGEVSDRQWRDVLSIVLVQDQRLDREYLAAMAARVGLTPLLERALRQGGAQ